MEDQIIGVKSTPPSLTTQENIIIDNSISRILFKETKKCRSYVLKTTFSTFLST